MAKHITRRTLIIKHFSMAPKENGKKEESERITARLRRQKHTRGNIKQHKQKREKRMVWLQRMKADRSVDESSRKGGEGLLELEAFGDGLLVRGQALLVGGLTALAEGVGRHDDELLRQLSALLLHLFVVAGGGGADGLGHALLPQPLVLQTGFSAGAAPADTTTTLTLKSPFTQTITPHLRSSSEHT